MTFQLTPSENVGDIEAQFRAAVEAAGLLPPRAVVFDGKLHRFDADKKGDKTGWYVAHADGIPAGKFGCWRSGIEQAWRANVHRSLTVDEEMLLTQRLSAARALRDAAKAEAAAMVSDIVSEIWEGASAADPDHPYLRRKGIQPHGARMTGDGRLMVPLYAPSGELSSLQYIDDAGHKLYHLTGATAGCYHTIGRLEGAKSLYLAEGFATGATIHEATGQPVAISYSASNLVPVCGELAQYGLPIVIVADNDKGGQGKRYAEQAAAKHGARYVMPPDVGDDANDYVHLRGGDLLALLEPQSTGWLVQADSFLDQPKPPKWIIRKWLPENCFAMVYGPSGGGKTFFVLDWCLTIASRIDKWNAQKVTPGSVVYLAGEGHHGLRARVAAWSSVRGVRPGALWVSKSGCDLDTPEGYLKARDAILETRERPSLIVVDTLHRFLSGDENSAQDARKMIAACSGLMREFSATVLLVHHTGASEESQHRARGSSAWRGSLDVEISVVPSEDGLVVSQRKMKDSDELDPIVGKLEKHEIPGWVDDEGEAVSSLVFDPTSESPAAKEKPKKDLAGLQWQKFIRAWHASGWETDGNVPTVSRSAMLALLRQDGLSDTQARNEIRADRPKSTIGILINAEILSTTEHGWRVTSPSHATSLMMQMGNR